MRIDAHVEPTGSSHRHDLAARTAAGASRKFVRGVCVAAAAGALALGLAAHAPADDAPATDAAAQAEPCDCAPAPAAHGSQAAVRSSPCLCPKELAEDPDAEDEEYYFLVARYEGECGCDEGPCDDPVMNVLVTDAFVEYPQYCEDEEIPCEFNNLAAAKGREQVRSIGLSKPKSPSFVPVFRDVPDAKVIYEAFLTFGPVGGHWRMAKVFIFHLPEHSHPSHPLDPKCPPQTVTIGFEVTPDDKTPEPTYRVDARRLKKYADDSEYVYYANVGGVTFPIVIAE